MPENPEAFHAAIAKAKEACQSFIAVAEDPFKPPEVLMEQIIPLQTAMYFLSVEWSVLLRQS